MNQELINYESIHLRVTDINKTIDFWEKTMRLSMRKISDNSAEVGTETKTLIYLEQDASTPVKNGYSGLYHFALHVNTERAFATILARLIRLNIPISPVDHIMSKAIYLEDPDGIVIEITLETPERFERYNMQDGLFQVIDSNGHHRGATEPLNIEEVLSKFEDLNIEGDFPEDTKIGHIHLYVPNLQIAYDFYKQIGFLDNLISIPIGFADLSAGGAFKHRIAFNTWQSLNRPHAPEGTAGMKHFTIKLNSKEQLDKVVNTVEGIEKIDDGYSLVDPAGNKFIITN